MPTQVVQNEQYVTCSYPETPCVLILPGGGELALNLVLDYPTPMGIATQIMASINTATAPMNALFRILEALNAALQCAVGVKDGVTHANPIEVLVSLGECLPNLIDKLSKLIPLVPPISTIAMLRGIVCSILQVLSAIESMIDTIRRSALRIEPMKNAIPILKDDRLVAIYNDGLWRICRVYRHTANLLGTLAVIWETVMLCGQLANVKIPAIDFGFMWGPTVDLRIEALDEAYNKVAKARQLVEAIYRVLP